MTKYSLLRNALAALLAVAVPLGAAVAVAQEPDNPVPRSEWARTEYGAVRMMSAESGIGEDGEVMIGVQMRLMGGWKTYWRSPGEAGVPTTFDWTGSDNLKSATVRWPAPRRFSEYDFETYGYEKEIVFPIVIEATDPGQPVDLKVHLSYGVCRDICIPMELDLAMQVPAEAEPQRTRYARTIEIFDQMVPRESGSGGIRIERVEVQQEHLTSQVEVFVKSEEPMSWPDLALELPAAYRTGVPSVNLSADRRRATLRMSLWADPGVPPLEGESVIVTVWDDNHRAIEAELEIERPASAVGASY